MKYPILIIFLLSCCLSQAQVSASHEATHDISAPGLKIADYQQVWKNHFQNSFSDNNHLLQVPSATLLTCSPNHLPGLFCKMEYKIETKSKLAPRFRLGSLNYTNWMEGKGSIYSRYWN